MLSPRSARPPRKLERLALAETVLDRSHADKSPTCTFCFRTSPTVAAASHARGMNAILKGKQPWQALALASAGLGLALYYLFTQQSLTPNNPSHSTVLQQDRQDNEAVHTADDMGPEERAYHEGFMREAIAMVKQPLHTPHTLACSSMPTFIHHI